MACPVPPSPQEAPSPEGQACGGGVTEGQGQASGSVISPDSAARFPCPTSCLPLWRLVAQGQRHGSGSPPRIVGKRKWMQSPPCGPWVYWGALPGGPSSPREEPQGWGPGGPRQKGGQEWGRGQDRAPGCYWPRRLPRVTAPRKRCFSAIGEGSQGQTHTSHQGSIIVSVYYRLLCATLIPGFCVLA